MKVSIEVEFDSLKKDWLFSVCDTWSTRYAFWSRVPLLSPAVNLGPQIHTPDTKTLDSSNPLPVCGYLITLYQGARSFLSPLVCLPALLRDVRIFSKQYRQQLSNSTHPYLIPELMISVSYVGQESILSWSDNFNLVLGADCPKSLASSFTKLPPHWIHYAIVA